MPGRARRVCLAVLAAAIALAVAPAAQAQEIDCPEGARCSALTVPLDHEGGTPGTQEVAYAVLPATGARTGTLVFLSGGPGEAAIPLAEGVATRLARLRSSYDMVFVDQRGTGASGAVDCDIDDEAAVRACGERLGVRRQFLSTRETAYDLEDLRAELGVEQLTLLGVSYGAKVAQTYARLYPSRVAAMVLDSPTPVDGLDSPFELRQLGLGRSLREVCQPGPCKETLRDASDALRVVVRRLRRAPLRGTVVLPSGRIQRFGITEAGLYGLILRSDTDPFLRADLPGALGSAAAGDSGPLLRIAGFVARAESAQEEAGAINTARLLATTCIEGRLPWAPDAPLEGRDEALAAFFSERRDAFRPFSTRTVAAQTSAALCADWPSTPAPAPVAYPGPDVRVLVLSGREDLRTPLEDARRTAGQYPNAKVLPVPDVGHSVLGSDTSGCAVRRTATFLAGGTVDYCTRRPRPIQPLPVIPPDLDDYRAGALGGDTGRTASAVSASLFAILREVSFVGASDGAVRLPGLRAGVSVVFEDRVELRGVEWVRGVRLTGTIRRGSGTIVISGSSAVPGRLRRTSGGFFRGTIGGEGVLIRQ
jgi:pimeloyl-ACP methyl ester carboxylesterase